jgi:hypothetical protein
MTSQDYRQSVGILHNYWIYRAISGKVDEKLRRIDIYKTNELEIVKTKFDEGLDTFIEIDDNRYLIEKMSSGTAGTKSYYSTYFNLGEHNDLAMKYPNNFKIIYMV